MPRSMDEDPDLDTQNQPIQVTTTTPSNGSQQTPALVSSTLPEREESSDGGVEQSNYSHVNQGSGPGKLESNVEGGEQNIHNSTVQLTIPNSTSNSVKIDDTNENSPTQITFNESWSFPEAPVSATSSSIQPVERSGLQDSPQDVTSADRILSQSTNSRTNTEVAPHTTASVQQGSHNESESNEKLQSDSTTADQQATDHTPAQARIKETWFSEKELEPSSEDAVEAPVLDGSNPRQSTSHATLESKELNGQEQSQLAQRQSSRQQTQVVPYQSFRRRGFQVPNRPRVTLLSLPPALHLEILPYLTWPAARALRQTCRDLRHLYPPRLVALLRPSYEASLLQNPLSVTLPCYSCTRLKSRLQFAPSNTARLFGAPPGPLLRANRVRIDPINPQPVRAIAPGGVERPVCNACWRTTFGDNVARALEGRTPKGECSRCRRKRKLVWGLHRVGIGGGVGVAAGEGGLCWLCSSKARTRDAMGRAVESERFWALLLGAVECGLCIAAIIMMVKLLRQERSSAEMGTGNGKYDRPEMIFASLYASYLLLNLSFWSISKFVSMKILRDVWGLRSFKRYLSRSALDGAMIILNLFIALLSAVAVALFTFFIRRIETIPLHGILSLLSLVAVPAAFARMLNHDD